MHPASQLKAELEKSVSSLSLEEAKEAVRQAQEAMAAGGVPFTGVEAREPSKTAAKRAAKTNKKLSTRSPAKGNSELDRIQREMQDMMKTLKQARDPS